MKPDVLHLPESEHITNIVKMGEDVKDDFLRLKMHFELPFADFFAYEKLQLKFFQFFN